MITSTGRGGPVPAGGGPDPEDQQDDEQTAEQHRIAEKQGEAQIGVAGGDQVGRASTARTQAVTAMSAPPKTTASAAGRALAHQAAGTGKGEGGDEDSQHYQSCRRQIGERPDEGVGPMGRWADRDDDEQGVQPDAQDQKADSVETHRQPPAQAGRHDQRQTDQIESQPGGGGRRRRARHRQRTWAGWP